MREKIKRIITVAIVLLQLSVPAGLIIMQRVETNLIEKYGQSFIFEATRFHFFNGHMNMYLLTNGEWLEMNDKIRYMIVDKDENGKTVYTATDTKPEGDNYIDTRIDRYDGESFPNIFIDTQIYENLNDIVLVKTATVQPPDSDEHLVYYKDVTAEAKVYKGKIIITQVYIDSIDYETYFEKLNEYYSK